MSDARWPCTSSRNRCPPTHQSERRFRGSENRDAGRMRCGIAQRPSMRLRRMPVVGRNDDRGKPAKGWQVRPLALGNLAVIEGFRIA